MEDQNDYLGSEMAKFGNWTLPRISDPVSTGRTLKWYKEVGREDIAWIGNGDAETKGNKNLTTWTQS